MDKSNTVKRVYVKPEMELIFVESAAQILEGSLSGAHHDAEDDETMNAKPGFFDDEDDSWAKGGNLWDED